MSLFFFTTKSQRKHKMPCFAAILMAILVASSPVMANEDPDDLYRQGRFSQAEKIYADEDMNRPKDIRFRYNRGCSAYQNGDYQAATAAFSSVLSRANDDGTRFRAVYNLGNTAFKQGDLASAINYYKQAILYDPNSADALHNLELALRKQEEQKKQEQNQQKGADSKGQRQSGSPEDQERQTEEKQSETPEERPGQSSREDSSQKEPSQEEPPQKEQREGEKDSDGKNEPDSEQEKGGQADTAAENDMQREGADPPTDLSGELKLRETTISEEREENEGTAPSAAVIDRKKAEALLNNIKEDRTRFLRYQLPEGKRGGASSGKDW